jgi:ribonuclease HI
MSSEQVVIYTDGACKGNPGAGGWGAWLRWGEHERELFGGDPHTTNNRMELTAVIESLALLKRRIAVAIYTDSELRQERHQPAGFTAGRSVAGSPPTTSR